MCSAPYREPAADVSDEEEGVVFEVAHHGVAAAHLRRPAVPLVVVADGAVPHHGQHEGEDPLVVTGGADGREEMSGFKLGALRVLSRRQDRFPPGCSHVKAAEFNHAV